MKKVSISLINKIFDDIVEGIAIEELVAIHNIFCNELNLDYLVIHDNNKENLNKLISHSCHRNSCVNVLLDSRRYSEIDKYIWLDDNEIIIGGTITEELPINKNILKNFFRENYMLLNSFNSFYDYITAANIYYNNGYYDEKLDFCYYDIVGIYGA